MGRVDILVAATFAISRSSDLDVRRQDGASLGGRGEGGEGGEGVEHLMNVRVDVQNSRISMVEHLNVVGALLLQSLYGICYSNENIARQKSDDVGGLLPHKKR